MAEENKRQETKVPDRKLDPQGAVVPGLSWIENLEKLRSDLNERPSKWWQSKFMVAVIAAIVPVTTAIYTGINRSRELDLADTQQKNRLALEAQQQQDKTRFEYLSMAIDPSRDPFYRQQVLRYLAKTAKLDSALAEWASEEEKRVTDKVNEIQRTRKERDAAQQEAQAQRKLAADLRSQMAKLSATATAERARLQRELDGARANMENSEAKQRKAERDLAAILSSPKKLETSSSAWWMTSTMDDALSKVQQQCPEAAVVATGVPVASCLKWLTNGSMGSLSVSANSAEWGSERLSSRPYPCHCSVEGILPATDTSGRVIIFPKGSWR